MNEVLQATIDAGGPISTIGVVYLLWMVRDLRRIMTYRVARIERVLRTTHPELAHLLEPVVDETAQI